jgi:hypothetical protein
MEITLDDEMLLECGWSDVAREAFQKSSAYGESAPATLNASWPASTFAFDSERNLPYLAPEYVRLPRNYEVSVRRREQTASYSETGASASLASEAVARACMRRS